MYFKFDILYVKVKFNLLKKINLLCFFKVLIFWWCWILINVLAKLNNSK